MCDSTTSAADEFDNTVSETNNCSSGILPIILRLRQICSYFSNNNNSSVSDEDATITDMIQISSKFEVSIFIILVMDMMKYNHTYIQLISIIIYKHISCCYY
jgi:hypothetical protein